MPAVMALDQAADLGCIFAIFPGGQNDFIEVYEDEGGTDMPNLVRLPDIGAGGDGG